MVSVAKGKPELDRCIDIIENWSRSNGIDINKAKSGIMQVRKDRRTLPLLAPEIRGYPVVTSYKYLGVQVDDCLKVDSELRKK